MSLFNYNVATPNQSRDCNRPRDYYLAFPLLLYLLLYHDAIIQIKHCLKKLLFRNL